MALRMSLPAAVTALVAICFVPSVAAGATVIAHGWREADGRVGGWVVLALDDRGTCSSSTTKRARSRGALLSLRSTG